MPLGGTAARNTAPPRPTSGNKYGRGGSESPRGTQPSAPQSNSLVDQYTAWSTQQGDALQGQYNSDLARAGAIRDVNLGFLNESASSDQARNNEARYRDVDLGRAANFAGREELKGRQALLDNRSSLNEQGYATDQKELGQASEWNLKDYLSDSNYLQSLFGQYNEDFGFNEAEFNQRSRGNEMVRNTANRRATSDATARGAISSSGYGADRQDIAGQYQLAQDQSLTSRQRSDASTTRQSQATYKQLQDTYAGYQKDAEGIGIGGERANQAYQGNRNTLAGQQLDIEARRGDIDRSDSALASLAKEYGVKDKDIANGFKQAASKMNLDYDDTRANLGKWLNSGNAELQARAYDFFTQMMAFA